MCALIMQFPAGTRRAEFTVTVAAATRSGHLERQTEEGTTKYLFDKT